MKQSGSPRQGIELDGGEGCHRLFEGGAGRLNQFKARFVEVRPGMIAVLYRGSGQEETHADLINNSPYVHFTCLLKDRSRTWVRGRELSPDIGAGYVVFAPGERFAVDYGVDYTHVDLMLLPETLADLTGDEGSGLNDKIGGGFVTQATPPGQRMVEAALRLADHVEVPPDRRLYLYAAALDFLAGHLAAAAPDPIPPRERQRLIAARERLLRDLSAAPTIAELAREIGLNQLKLKQGFKALFGSSIYALFQQHRMERARQLLRSYSVTETALILGYNNLSHFSTAFRKQFGILPRHERKGLIN